MPIFHNFRAKAADALTGGLLSRALESAHQSNAYTGHLKESIHELEHGLTNPKDGDGWIPVEAAIEGKEFSRRALRAMHRLALLFYLKNPLIRRGVKIQSGYVMGQGMEVHSCDDATNTVLQQFHDNRGNRRALTDSKVLIQRENELQIFGNLIFVFFTNRATGAVQVRTFDIDEIESVISNPDDKDEPWFYERVYIARVLDYSTGRWTTEPRTEYYPDWNYNPAIKPVTIAGKPVYWDRPIYHVKGDVVGAMDIAPSEVFAAIDWAKAYTRFLEHRATVAAALSKFVRTIKKKTQAGIERAKTKMTTTFAGTSSPLGAADGEVGRDVYVGDGGDIEPMTVKGATINPDEGRRFLLMVCAAFGFSETFFGDASVGSLATAKSLDRPTEIAMEARRNLWKTVRLDIANYVLLQAARAPLNPFSKVAKVVYFGDTPVVQVRDEKGAFSTVDIDIDFPALIDHDVKERVEAIAKAAPYLRPLKKLLAKLMLKALREDDLDESLRLLPDDKVITEWEVEPVTPPRSGDIDDENEPETKKPAKAVQTERKDGSKI
jgi:hypothetical protein